MFILGPRLLSAVMSSECCFSSVCGLPRASFFSVGQVSPVTWGAVARGRSPSFTSDAPMESGHELEALSSRCFAWPCVRSLDSGSFPSSVVIPLAHSHSHSLGDALIPAPDAEG